MSELSESVSATRQNWWRVHRTLFFILALFYASILISFSVIFLECPEFLQYFTSSRNDTFGHSGTRRLYIPGAGFSGFFYTLGRLNTLLHGAIDQHEDEYYCFSAGCLALVASFMEIPLTQVVEIAHTSRRKWMRGEIGRYEVVGSFVDEMLQIGTYEEYVSFNRSSYGIRLDQSEYSYNETVLKSSSLTNSTTLIQSSPHKILQHLPKMYIITSTWSRKKMISKSIRTPSTVSELKQMLLQTMWIPFVTGESLGKQHHSGEYHNDGAFVALMHGWKILFKNKKWIDTTHSLKLPWDAQLIFNGLNIDLDEKLALHFWNKGLYREEAGNQNVERTSIIKQFLLCTSTSSFLLAYSLK